MVKTPPPPVPDTESESPFKRLQMWSGKRRQQLARKFSETAHEQVDGFAGDEAFCKRLLQVYDEMRRHPHARPPRPSALLSHVPEWAQSLQIDDHISNEGFSLKALRHVPRLQAALANCTSYTPSKWLLEQELSARYSNQAMSAIETGSPRDADDLIARYEKLVGNKHSWTLPDSAGSGSNSGQRGDVYDAAAHEQLSGLGLSGGGIRSATFCLGILQTLAAHNLIGKFDYISSVSGGGYIHEWLAAWIHREPRGLASVQYKLVPLPTAGSLARAPEQINWLRRYSSYLTPQRGLFTADTWTMATIWLRNTFLNQIVLFSFLAVGIMSVRAVMHPFTMQLVANAYRPATMAGMVNLVWQWVFALVAAVGLVWAGYGVFTFSRALASQTDPPRAGAMPPPGAIGNFEVVGLIVLPGFLLSVLSALSSSGVFRFHDLSGDTLDGLQEVWNRHSGGFHLMMFAWAAYVLALLIAETVGGNAVESAGNNSRLGYPWLRRLGYGASIALCTLLPVSVAMYGSIVGYRAVTIQQGSVIVAHRLDQLFDGLPEAATAVGSANQSSSAASDSSPASVKSSPGLPSPTNDLAGTSVNPAASPKHPIRSQALVALSLPLLFFAAQFMAIRLHLGLLGRSYEESRREWLARYGAWAAIVSFLWLGLGAIALIGPNVYYWFFDSGHTRKLISAGVVALIHAVTLYSGSSSKTSGAPDPRKFFGYSAFDLLGIVGAPIAILSLLIIASGLVDIGINSSWHFHDWAVHQHFLDNLQLGAEPGGILSGALLLFRYQFEVLGPVLLFFAYAAVLLLFGWRVDVNEFSMHPFYRDRLARCYIGASNGCRVPDPFTGFDDHTEASSRAGIALAELLPVRFGGKATRNAGDNWPPYDGPMPIFCSTVNLTFGEDLAFQDRMGASFAFTPFYTGYHVGWTAEQGGEACTTTYNGFVPTRDYAYRAQTRGSHGGAGSGVPLATVAAISGAALSPNQGYSSQPTLAFLMTLFNARLGWWIANPRKPWIWPNELDQPTPHFGLRYLLSELFGHSDDTSNYVSLSDGGRFDNMGLYELVRRRCTLIVICDGEQDDNTTFEGFGLAIAKARIDFGVEIEFPPDQIKALTPDEDTNCSSTHFACGSIKYPAPPGGDSTNGRYLGKIVYLKTAFVGDESLDIRHYKREHPDFPQESTLNQWFTEPQFESYRRLGQLTAEQAIGQIAPQHS
jgi:hypothetical protein